MSLEQLIQILDENEEVGKNDSDINDMQIAVANIKLRKNGIAQIPDDFATLLKKYNGLSCGGNTIFGINTGTSFFPDLVDFNINMLADEDVSCVILGQDDDFYLIYDEEKLCYRIIDQSDFFEELSTDDLTTAVTWILKI